MSNEWSDISISLLPDSWGQLVQLNYIDQLQATRVAGEEAEEASETSKETKKIVEAQQKAIDELEVSIDNAVKESAKNGRAISSHVSSNSQHGVNGNNVGTLDYAQGSVGGVVLLANAVVKLIPPTLPSAPSAYDQAEEQAFRNSVYSSISTITSAVNAIITSQQNALQMSGGGGGGGAPVVTLSPTSSTESVGLPFSFYSDFSGSELSYQWYEYGVAIPGATDKIYTFTPTSDKNGGEYYCIATNAEGSAQTNTATLSLRYRIFFDTSAWPVFDSEDTVKLTFKDNGFIDVTTSEGVLTDFDNWIGPVGDPDLPTFNLSDYRTRVSNLSGPITIEPGSIGQAFETLINGSYIEINPSGLSDGQSTFFDVEFEDTLLPGYDWAGWDNGNVFVRKADPGIAPFFTTQPVDVTKAQGFQAKFTAIADGDPTITYQWEYQDSGSSLWQEWSGETSTELAFITNPSQNQMKVRCKASNPAGDTYSNVATLTVVS